MDYFESHAPTILTSMPSYSEVLGDQSLQAVHYFGIKSGEQAEDYPCGFRYRAGSRSSGHFQSPNYPGLYPRNTECHYFFHGHDGQRIRIQFHDFDVEGVHPCDAGSASDYVEFSNFMGLDRKYTRQCGQLTPFEVESERKFFRVTFRSNDRLDGTGFNASFLFIEDPTPSPTPQPTSFAVVRALGSSLWLLVISFLVT
nr:suppressor of lurcher protein 1-like [Halyomorpha halys]